MSFMSTIIWMSDSIHIHAANLLRFWGRDQKRVSHSLWGYWVVAEWCEIMTASMIWLLPHWGIRTDSWDYCTMHILWCIWLECLPAMLPNVYITRRLTIITLCISSQWISLQIVIVYQDHVVFVLRVPSWSEQKEHLSQHHSSFPQWPTSPWKDDQSSNKMLANSK